MRKYPRGLTEEERVLYDWWYARHPVALRLHERGWAKSLLARRVGVSEGSLRGWMTGQTDMTVGYLERLAQALGVTAPRLLHEIQEWRARSPEGRNAESYLSILMAELEELK